MKAGVGGVAHVPAELRAGRPLAFDDLDIVTSVENWDVIEAMKTISCHVGYHRGGLGQHFSQFVEDARRVGELKRYFSTHVKPADEGRTGQALTRRVSPWLMRWTPVRFDPGWRWHVDCDLWDRKIARLLEPGMECFVGFGGMSLHSFRAARRMGCPRLELIAANTHVDNCFRLHAKATQRHPIERPWLNDVHRRKTVEEYAMADVIWYASDYAREMFVRHGVGEKKLRRIHYTTDPRFTPDPAAKPKDGVFRVVYVGALTVTKGIPVLLEAFEKYQDGPAELTLVGGSSTRGMRKYLERWLKRDPRVKIAPGDPLPHLRRADVCVHPSWEDNLAYSALEAIQVGVTVVVTADTGMKEYVREGENGYVVPTGDGDAILERMREVARRR
jgi:glycosyltransferase involved in cell wall biosynthesis